MAKDLRLLVRERLMAGDTDAEVMAYVVDRYGEFVLLRPTASGSNIVLWLAAPALLLGGLGLAVVSIRRRQELYSPAIRNVARALPVSFS